MVIASEVPVILKLYCPTDTLPIPEMVAVTSVPSAVAVAGLKVAVAPVGNPSAEKVVVPVNPKNVL